MVLASRATEDIRSDSCPELTSMERRVLRLVSLGCSLPEMAAILRRSLATIDNHKTRGMRKLGAHKAAEVTRAVIQLGISPLFDRLSDEEVAQLERAASKLADQAVRAVT